jgi:hypothetical protein
MAAAGYKERPDGRTYGRRRQHVASAGAQNVGMQARYVPSVSDNKHPRELMRSAGAVECFRHDVTCFILVPGDE